eukprot:scaffold2782_cov182-Amphora_coffeaeformis.AAC.36
MENLSLILKAFPSIHGYPESWRGVQFCWAVSAGDSKSSRCSQSIASQNFPVTEASIYISACTPPVISNNTRQFWTCCAAFPLLITIFSKPASLDMYYNIGSEQSKELQVLPQEDETNRRERRRGGFAIKNNVCDKVDLYQRPNPCGNYLQGRTSHFRYQMTEEEDESGPEEPLTYRFILPLKLLLKRHI